MAAEDYLPWGEGWYPGEMEPIPNPETKPRMKDTTMSNIPMPKVPAPKRAATTTAAPSAPAPAKLNLADMLGKQQTATEPGQFIILAGKGGTGKSTGALAKDGKTVFVDLEGSFAKIAKRAFALWPDREKDVTRFSFPFTEDGAADYETLCALLEANGYDGYQTVVIDSWTVVQKLLKEYTFAHDQYKGKACSSTEDYGYSTFPIYAFKNYTRIMNAMLAHVRAGRDVIVIAHAVDETIPDAALNDMKQWQFDAFMMKSGKESIRHDMFNAADQVWFLTDGTVASDKGKATAGCRMVYLNGTGTVMAKSRTYSGAPALLVPDGEALPWNLLNV